MEDELHHIQNQLQKFMEGMTILNDRNVQTNKELMEIRDAIGSLNQKGKKRDPVRAEFASDRGCFGEMQQGARFKDIHTGNDLNHNGMFFTLYSRLEFSRFSEVS